jgi:hypothetical protein
MLPDNLLPSEPYKNITGINAAPNPTNSSPLSASPAPIGNIATHPLTWSSSRRILEVLIEAENHPPAESSSMNNQGVMDESWSTQRRGHPSADQRQQLLNRLDRLNLDMVAMVGDGNCQVICYATVETRELTIGFNVQCWTRGIMNFFTCMLQFRALSNELYGTQEEHAKVRRDVVQYIK